MTNTVNFHIIIHFNTLIYCQFIMAHNMHNNTRNKILKVFLKKEVTSHYPALSETDSTIKQVIMILNSTNIMGGTIMKLKKKAKKGFTLIELLIVVAIIAILAAIAIPQFSAYRVRGYNSAAASDLRNAKLAITAFSTDNAAYAGTLGCTAGTAACANTGPGQGVLLTGPLAYSISTAQYSIVPAQIPSADVIWSLGLSSGVKEGISTFNLGAYYVATAGHTSGDTIFAAHSQMTSLMRSGKSIAGLPVVVTSGVAGGPLMYLPPCTALPTTDLPAGSGFVSM